MWRGLWIASTAWAAFSLHAAPIEVDQELREVRSTVEMLERDLAELQVSLHSLDRTQESLTAELREYERDLETRLTRSVLPLLAWPEHRLSVRAHSWVEHQRAEFLVQALRKQLVKEPLGLVSERERRIREISALREELSGKLSQLQIKRSLLNFQLEELNMIQRRSQVDLPQASGRTKNLP